MGDNSRFLHLERKGKMRTGLGVKTAYFVLLCLLCMGQQNSVQQAQAEGAYTAFLPAVRKPQVPIPLPSILTTIQLPSGSHPHGIALDTDGQRAFVGNHEGNSLSVLDTASMSVLQTIPLSGTDGPNGVAYYPPTDRVYVANRDTANVSLVNVVFPASVMFRSVPVRLAAVIVSLVASASASSTFKLSVLPPSIEILPAVPSVLMS